MTAQKNLPFPNKSHRKVVRIPKRSAKLAEFFGIMMGDGGINNQWQANITVNAVADAEYAVYVVKLIEELFGISPAVRRRKERRALIICISSMSVVEFLIDNGLIRGNKIKGGLAIPEWILQKRSYRIACVRGLIDTDGCLYVHRHKVSGREYKNIGFCFTSHSPVLIRQVAEIFEEFSIIPHITKQGRQIFLYSHSAVACYLAVFGTSNGRISSVFKKFGGVG